MRLYLIVHNVRSAHNVGSLLRTADGLGVDKVYLSGYTPYPNMPGDKRLPHEAAKIHRRIQKTALGAEAMTAWQHIDDIERLIAGLKKDNVTIAALEQTDAAQDISGFKIKDDIALVVGSERGGITTDVLKLCDIYLQIPMFGKKDSFNVAVAAAMALYHLRFSS